LPLIAEFVNRVVMILLVILFARAILSWFIQDPYNPIMRILIDLTEPILAPIRRRMPPMAGLDLSLIVAGFGIMIIGRLIVGLLAGSSF
jgi:YggT family protein